jgi:glycosyltransferase involved in cell wall biosynthesis
MHISMITPYYHQPRGNTVTVKRISDALQGLGHQVDITSITGDDEYPPFPKGELVHGFNAYQFYKYWSSGQRPLVPYVVTMTGTDLNHNLFDPLTRDEVLQSMKGARAVHVFNEKARDMLWAEAPWVKGKTFLIPQAIAEFPNAEHVEKEPNTFVFLLPAGIRKVKNVPEAISLLTALHASDARVRLWLVGPVIDEEEGRNVQQLIKDHAGWIRYFGQVEHRTMGGLYRGADVVINTSLSEGQSSAILEAMAEGLPVLVSNITGNRDIVTHGEQGFLYEYKEMFLHYARLLMQDRTLRATLGEMGRRYVEAHHSAANEARDIAAMYQWIVAGGQLHEGGANRG